MCWGWDHRDRIFDYLQDKKKKQKIQREFRIEDKLKASKDRERADIKIKIRKEKINHCSPNKQEIYVRRRYVVLRR